MAKIEFPKQLKSLLDDSPLQAPLRALADRVGEIVADNKLPFFPDYTDHGAEHINRVLQSEVGLVPYEVWQRSAPESDSRLLYDADAAVIIGATLVHDLAMHLHPAGFLELVGDGSRLQPLPWFRERQQGYSPDRPWPELWRDYVREARRFSDRALGNFIGPDSVREGWKFQDLPENPGRWERNHHLVIGEFLRRHHARLAHEITIFGFPGLPVGSGEGQFAALGSEPGHPLGRLADLIGVTARSHGISLRACKDYIDSVAKYRGTPRPMGAAVLYAMALLRVADYLQIAHDRAPAVLLQLRDPQSPISLQEWSKHRAVEHIGPGTNPRAVRVTVTEEVALEVYLQLRDLLAGLQAELDHSSAVLDEVYGLRPDLGLNHLNLDIRRVESNLLDPAFRDALHYVPERTGFAADPNLLPLLVEPLYGAHPGVAVRELVQNAVDAVRELHVWCETRPTPLASLDPPEPDADVLVDFIRREDGSWFLRVTDRGIGMTSGTIEKYFLRAGASFRRSPEWVKEFVDAEGRSQVPRAGRFGIGAFAVFLLGPVIRLWTRHATASTAECFTLRASAGDHLIEIRRATSRPVGTTIEVEISRDAADALGLDAVHGEKGWYRTATDWFCWDWPRVVRRVIRGPTVEVLEQQYAAPLRARVPPPEWSAIAPSGFDAVYWTFGDHPRVTCNGLRIDKPQLASHEAAPMSQLGRGCGSRRWKLCRCRPSGTNVSAPPSSPSIPPRAAR